MIRNLPNACAVLAAVSLLASPAAGSGLPEVHEKSDQVIEARDLRELVVENARGFVQLRPSPDGRLHLTAWKSSRAQSRERAEEMSRQTIVHAAREGNRYRVRVEYPRRIDVRIDFWDLFKGRTWDSNHMPRAEVRMVAEVPKGLVVRVTTASGDIESQGLAAAQELTTASGDVSLQDLTGALVVQTASGDVSAKGITRLTVRTASGDVEVEQASGPLNSLTTSGDVTVDGVTDSVRAESSSGDLVVTEAPKGIIALSTSGEIVVRSAAGRIQLESSSGDVHCGLRAPLAGADIGSLSGEVVVEFAPGVGAALDLRTASGTLECAIPVRLKESNRRGMVGEVGRGGSAVHLHTASGDITVTGGGQ